MTRTTFLLTAVAMIAFAANSVLCRLALGGELIDAASFATLRTSSGAAVLAIALLLRPGKPHWRPDVRAVASLCFYMVCFTFAYLSLSAGTGALVLFGAVQLTMFGFALAAGESFPPMSWAGLVIAVAGLVYLVSPGLSAPDPAGAALMAIAGIAWGCYSLTGRTTTDAVAATARNFLWAVPPVMLVTFAIVDDVQVTAAGTAYALVSGVVASGLGYVIWYAALGGLAATSAATVQLSVPVIAAIGGVLLLSEEASFRLLVASAATLGGVAMALKR